MFGLLPDNLSESAAKGKGKNKVINRVQQQAATHFILYYSRADEISCVSVTESMNLHTVFAVTFNVC